MEYLHRIQSYQQLVADVKQELTSHPFGMLDCKECEEINLWAYWQGGQNHLDARILLIGQDWGAVGTPERNAQISRICRTKPDGCNYLHETIGISDTDQNLVRLFRSIGYDIEKKKYPELFFTNYAIGYRSTRDTGKIPLKDWLKLSQPYMLQLIELIQPEVVLCLGKEVYQAVLRLDPTPKRREPIRWNACIEAGGERITCGTTSVYVIPLAHPGFFGSSNRNRGYRITDKLELQLRDWHCFAKTHQVYGPDSGK